MRHKAENRRPWRLAIAALAAFSAVCFAQEQYPPPLLHTPTDHPAARVVLLSVDGLHAVDLANWVAGHPGSALAALSTRGVTYTNAHAPMANAAAGLLALTTGGTPISTGIESEDGYDRGLSPGASTTCAARGAEIDLKAMLGADGKLDPAKAPRDPAKGCASMEPHNLLHVNTIFEVVREKIGETAWAGENQATTDLLRGPSGKGLVRSAVATGSARDADTARVGALLRWIDGAGESGASIPVPALSGMSFASVAESQAHDGYVDAVGTPSAGLAHALTFVDDSIGRIVRELKSKGLYESTWIAIAAPFGQSPMDGRRRRAIPLERVRAAVESVQPGGIAHITGGDVAMVWLHDSGQTPAVVKAFGDQAPELGIQEIDYGARLALTLNPPARDARMPDVILQPEYGVLWVSPDDKALASHGGTLDEDTHVALLISGQQLTGRYDPTFVPTTQLGPLLLRALGMEKFDLDALHQEHSPALPGIF